MMGLEEGAMIYLVGIASEPGFVAQVEADSRAAAARILADGLWRAGEIRADHPVTIWAELADAKGVSMPPPLHKRMAFRAELDVSVRITEVTT